jgi:hypothetical protein
MRCLRVNKQVKWMAAARKALGRPAAFLDGHIAPAVTVGQRRFADSVELL